jgi:hypothetical protein
MQYYNGVPSADRLGCSMIRKKHLCHLFTSNTHNNNAYLVADRSFAMYKRLKPCVLAGLEPSIFRSAGCCVDHCATPTGLLKIVFKVLHFSSSTTPFSIILSSSPSGAPGGAGHVLETPSFLGCSVRLSSVMRQLIIQANIFTLVLCRMHKWIVCKSLVRNHNS